MADNIKIFTLGVLFALVLLLSSTDPARALSLAAPKAFDINFTNITTYDGLKAEKAAYSNVFMLSGVDDGRVLEIHPSLISELTSGRGEINVNLNSDTNKLNFCSYLDRTNICAPGIGGIDEDGVIRVEIKLSEDARKAEKLFLSAYQYGTTPFELESILKKDGLDEYKKYSSFITGNDEKIIEDFRINGRLNDKRFMIEGYIYYDPNVPTLSQKREFEESNVRTTTLLEILKSAFLFLSGTIMSVAVVLSISKLKKGIKTGWPMVILLFAVSTLMFLSFYILNMYFGIELL